MVGNFIDLAEDDEEENGKEQGNNKISEWTRMNMLGEAKNILSSGLKFLNPQTAEACSRGIPIDQSSSNIPFLKSRQIQQSISSMTFTTEEKSLCSNIEKNTFLIPSVIPDSSSSLSPRIFGIFGDDVESRRISLSNSVNPMERYLFINPNLTQKKHQKCNFGTV